VRTTTVRRTQLAQARGGTTATSVYSPTQGTIVCVQSMLLANTSGADATYRIFHDNDGTTYSEATALAWDVSLPADSIVHLEANTEEGHIYADNPDGNIAFRCSVANAITITLYGRVLT